PAWLWQVRLQPGAERPLRERAHALLEHASVAADQYAVLQPAAGVAEQECRIGAAAVVDQNRIEHGAVLEVVAPRTGIVARDADDLETLRGERRAGAVEQRNFLSARPAPGRPEVDQHEPAVPFAQVACAAFGIFERQVE